jgi:hypothetical protein
VSVRNRTGAGKAINPDNIVIHYVVLVLLAGVIAATFIGSADGLLHAAGWFLPVQLQWTVLVAVDVFLIACGIATLAMRRRRAHSATVVLVALTVLLVVYSSAMNWTYVEQTIGIDTTIGLWSAMTKAAMPWLLLASLEVAAAMLSIRNNREASPLNKAKAENKKLRAQLRAANKNQRTPRTAQAQPALFDEQVPA